LIEINQIFYNESSKRNCYDFTNHYYNNPDNRFDMCLFENRVIAELIETSNLQSNDIFSVLSHKFKAAKSTTPIFGKQSLIFNLENIQRLFDESDTQLLTFFRNNRTKNIILQSKSNHPKTPFIQALDLLLKTANIDFNVLQPIPHRVYIMRNAFIARFGIYQRYYNEMLKPCIDAMKDENNVRLNELLWQSANYSVERMRFKDNPKLTQFFKHYTLHPFILERLPSIWLTINREIICNHW
jgi:hypothetical protein